MVLGAGSLLQAQSDAWVIGPWTRASDAPVIAPLPKSVFNDPVSGKAVHWEALHTFNPAAIVRNGKIYVLYRAEDDSGEMQIGMHVSRLGLAVSADGVHFERMPEPEFYPADDLQADREQPGGVEDPRVVQSEDGRYVLTYTQWSRKRNAYRVGIATSTDLIHWTKHGPAFAGASGGKYDALLYKSAGIVTRRLGEKIVAAKINGKYWMYWGEIKVGVATSTDLIHWTPVEDASGKSVVLLEARASRSDSAFPETGPPAVVTSRGVVMMYNAKNATDDTRDKSLAAGAYSVQEALFSADDPAKLLARTEQPVFKPERPFEQSGQYAAGTTFAEGLVLFKGKWWMYYGCADSFVGVAVAVEAATPRIASENSFVELETAMKIDVDGAPNAYGSPGKPTLDYELNAHAGARKEGKIVGYMTKEDGVTPVLQGPNDPFPGYYISETRFSDQRNPNTFDPKRYVDASRINYVVLGSFAISQHVGMGDFVAVYSKKTGRSVYGIVGDSGNSSGAEGSLALFQSLGYAFKDGKAGEVSKKEIVIRYFPGVQ